MRFVFDSSLTEEAKKRIETVGKQRYILVDGRYRVVIQGGEPITEVRSEAANV